MKKPSRPARQVCPLCAIDDEVELTSEGPDMWVFVCHRGHPAQPYQWTPTAHTVAPPGRTAVGDDLGVYEALLACVHGDERVEYGVVEYRYAERSPAEYAKLVEKYGHRWLGETVYSASVFLAHALSDNSNEKVYWRSRGYPEAVIGPTWTGSPLGHSQGQVRPARCRPGRASP